MQYYHKIMLEERVRALQEECLS